MSGKSTVFGIVEELRAAFSVLNKTKIKPPFFLRRSMLCFKQERKQQQ
jgi:hypothetical protein